MFQFFDLIMTSPIGVFIAGLVQDVIYAALIVSDCDECGFNDLGKLLFGGLIAAIIVGVAVSILLDAQRETGRTNRSLCRLLQRDVMTKSTQVDNLRYSRREGIPRRIAKDPEENEHH